MIQVLIPMADGEYLHPDVLQSLAKQTIKTMVFVVTRPRTSDYKGRMCQVECRNILKQYAANNYVVMMDSDVVLTGERDIEDMVMFLFKHIEYDAVALHTKEASILDQLHINAACVCVRSQRLRLITFAADKDFCTCYCFRNIRYLDNRQLHEVKR